MTSKPIEGSSTPSRTSGGTAHLLPLERAKATFSVEELNAFLHGGRKARDTRAEFATIFDDPVFESDYDHHDTREESLRKGVARTVAAYKALKRSPEALEAHMDGYLGAGGPGFGVGSHIHSTGSAVGNHYGIFVGALLARANDEQKARWLQKAINLKILGAYAQTEVGHGSNVRGLQTTARFDPSTQEFIIDSPTLTASKWWPGCFGLLATHCVVYARLILDGKDYGIKEFMVQLRDADHKMMPGVEVGDIGAKIGYNAVDSGYSIFTDVRIPRFNMLSRYEEVTPEGKLKKLGGIKKTKGAAGDKLRYIVMITTRVSMTSGAYLALAKAATIAIRYSAVRHQGFKNTRSDSMASGENAVLDYQVQQYRLFKALSMAYAFAMVSKAVRQQLGLFRKSLDSGDVSALPELHATAAGLKAFCTNLAGDQMEECRRCCGGHGSTLNSGVAELVSTFNAISPIAEGDKVVLVLQTARFLVRARQAALKKEPVSGQADYLVPASLSEPDLSRPRSLEALVHAFKFRARQAVIAATESFERDLASGMTFDAAWNNNAVALHKAAHDHTFYVILSRFASVLDGLARGSMTVALNRLALHFGLVHLRENLGDWAGYVTAAQVRAIDTQIVRLLAEIRPDAVPLVDAFGFSDKALNSVLGRSDGNVYEALHDSARTCPLNRPEFADTIWRESLSQVLDRKFLTEEASRQRAGPPRSKL